MLPQLADWQLAGLKSSRRLRVDPEAVNEAVGIMHNVFGAEWLQRACDRAAGEALAFRAHAIGNLLVPPSDNQVIDLLELVHYIKAAGNASAYNELIAGLKAQYGPTFLQLAFGSRLKRAGAGGVHYEPPVLAGLKGDIGFTFGGTEFVAECYIPRNKRLTEEANWLLMKSIELRGGTDGRPAVLAISIKLKNTPTSQARKQIVRLVRESCARIEANVKANLGDDSEFMENESAFISVARTVAVGPGAHSLGRQHQKFPNMSGQQPFLFARVGVGLQGSPGSPMPVETETRDSVAIWLSDEDRVARSLDRDLDAPLAELTRKLERKLVQAKRTDSTERVLIVSTWLTDQLHRASPVARRNLERVLFEKHSRVAGVLFVLKARLRRTNEVERPYYRIVQLLPKRETAFPQLLERLIALEERDLVPPIF